MSRPRSFDPNVRPLYEAAMTADDEFIAAIQAAGGASRYALTDDVAMDARVIERYARKVQADNAWLAALRLMGAPPPS